MDKQDGDQRERKIHTAGSGKRADRYKKDRNRSRRENKKRKVDEGTSHAASGNGIPAAAQKPPTKSKSGSSNGPPWYKKKITLVIAGILLVVLFAASLFGLFYTNVLELPSGSAESAEDLTTENGAATVEEPELTPLQQEVAAMPLEMKIGQMFMFGFEGTEPSEEIIQLVRHQKIGALLLYERNIDSHDQVSGMNNAMQGVAADAGHPVRLMIAIDQEGGATRRMDTIGPFYSEPMLGEMGDTGAEVSEQQASFAARDLKGIGINTNLAPVVDVSDGWGTLMDTRSYGTDPEHVANLGSMAVRGYNKATTICSPKHFPGHGSADEDSHDGLPYVYTSRELLDEYELLPFQAVIEEGAPMIMVGHLVVPALDPDERPATMSKPIMTDLLRGQMGFDGVIITDDMEMSAIADNWGVSEASIVAVEAGADLLILAHTYDDQVATYEALLGAVQSGRISEARINESVERIVEMKRKYRLELR